MIKKQNKIITKIYNRFNIIIRETKTKTNKVYCTNFTFVNILSLKIEEVWLCSYG